MPDENSNAPFISVFAAGMLPAYEQTISDAAEKMTIKAHITAVVDTADLTAVVKFDPLSFLIFENGRDM